MNKQRNDSIKMKKPECESYAFESQEYNSCDFSMFSDHVKYVHRGGKLSDESIKFSIRVHKNVWIHHTLEFSDLQEFENFLIHSLEDIFDIKIREVVDIDVREDVDNIYSNIHGELWYASISKYVDVTDYVNPRYKAILTRPQFLVEMMRLCSCEYILEFTERSMNYPDHSPLDM